MPNTRASRCFCATDPFPGLSGLKTAPNRRCVLASSRLSSTDGADDTDVALSCTRPSTTAYRCHLCHLWRNERIHADCAVKGIKTRWVWILSTHGAARTYLCAPSMGTIGYYLAIPFIYGIAWLPFPLLYFLSDLTYFLLFRVLRVPERGGAHEPTEQLSGKERGRDPKRSHRSFYRWFCDLTLETLKTLTISPETVRERVTFEGTEILTRLCPGEPKHDHRTGAFRELGTGRCTVQRRTRTSAVVRDLPSVSRTNTSTA